MLRLAQRRMPGLEAAIVPGADHIAAMSQPDDVNGQIIRFLQKGGRARMAAVDAQKIP
jgi:pimeloyl-ACP methyl ester carboxylesterase